MGLTPDLLTGIDEIDQQHQVLFNCLTSLEQAVTDDKNWSAVHFAIDEMWDFARIHFAVEEAVMRMHAFPGYAAHATEHRAFVTELNAIRKKSLHDDVGHDMIHFLRRWLVNHIGKTDKQYVSHLLTARVVTHLPPVEPA